MHTAYILVGERDSLHTVMTAEAISYRDSVHTAVRMITLHPPPPAFAPALYISYPRTASRDHYSASRDPVHYYPKQTSARPQRHPSVFLFDRRMQTYAGLRTDVRTYVREWLLAAGCLGVDVVVLIFRVVSVWLYV